MSDPVRQSISMNNYRTAMWYWLSYEPDEDRWTAYRDQEPTFKFTSKYIVNVKPRVTRKLLRYEDTRAK